LVATKDNLLMDLRAILAGQPSLPGKETALRNSDDSLAREQDLN